MNNPVVAAVVATLHNLLCITASEGRASRIAEEAVDFMLEKNRGAELQDLYLAAFMFYPVFLRKVGERFRSTLEVASV
jgi:hypothetical protein